MTHTENERQVWLSHPSQGLTWEERVILKPESSSILNYIRKFEILQIKGKCIISKLMTTRNIFIFDSTERKDKKKKSTKNLKQQNTRIKQKRKFWNWPERKSQHVHTNTSGLTAAFSSEMIMEVGKWWPNTFNMYKQHDQMQILYILKTPPQSNGEIFKSNQEIKLKTWKKKQGPSDWIIWYKNLELLKKVPLEARI